MTPLTLRLDQYLAIRRSFGHSLSTAERVLRRFAEFAAAEGLPDLGRGPGDGQLKEMR